MQSLKALFDEAENKSREASAATARATAAIQSAFVRLLPPGTVFDLRDRRKRDFPDYLRSVKTIGGKDHGSQIFRIEQITQVRFDPTRPELATWEANAMAISEKTGKDLDGRVSHSLSNRGKCVCITGTLCIAHSPEETVDEQIARLLSMLGNAA